MDNDETMKDMQSIVRMDIAGLLGTLGQMLVTMEGPVRADHLARPISPALLDEFANKVSEFQFDAAKLRTAYKVAWDDLKPAVDKADDDG